LEEALALEAPGRRLVDVGPAPLAQIQELLHELALEDREVFAVPVGEVRVVVDAQCAGTEASHSSTMHGRPRNLGWAATASRAARTSRSILRLEGDCFRGAGPPSGP